MKTITHFLFGFGILFTSFSVICLGDSPVLAIVLLIATFVLAAIYLILIGITFIGITYIILYVGAIAVLFLFVIMMLNLKDKDLIEPSSVVSSAQQDRMVGIASRVGATTAPVSLNNGIYSLIIVFLFGSLIYSLTSFPLNFKNLIALEYLGLKDWSYLKISTMVNASAYPGTDHLNNLKGNNPLSILADTNQANISVTNLPHPELLDLSKVLHSAGEVSHADIALLDLTQIETLGHDLYTYGAVLLISLSIILLLAMFATIIISKPNMLHPFAVAQHTVQPR